MEIKGPRFYTVRCVCVCVCVCDMIDMYWLLFDKSDCLSYRRLNADLHWAARTAGTAVAAEDALEIARHSYHLLTSSPINVSQHCQTTPMVSASNTAQPD